MRKNKLIYHSALSEPLIGNEETTVVNIDGNTAMYNNIVNGLPFEFSKCDILYTELSWVAGIDKFNNRSNEETSYEEYMIGVSKTIKSSCRATIIISGKKDKPYLPYTDTILDIKLNGANAQAYVYNHVVKGEHYTTNALLEYLSNEFNCIGDFCCGYGNSGHVFMKNNKNFVMSDYNKKCITYIKKWMNENLQQD